MIKHVSINRFEGNSIIERIEGNGWDIDANRIELNGINAQIIDDPENRIISLNGPAVEDLFKSLRDLLKENSKLRMDIDDMDKGDESVNYCTNDVLATETLYLNKTIEEKEDRIKKLEKDLKEKEDVIEEKKARIRTLNKELLGKNIEIDALNNSLSNYYKLSEKCSILENKLTVTDKLNPILNFVSEAAGDNVNFAIKTFLYFTPDYDVTVSVSRKEEKDIEINKPGKYDITKEITRWLDGEIKNKTDYATKIFNKESKENIFSITFCKVPVEPEGVANEQS